MNPYLQMAFALAHKLAERDETSTRERAQFRAIAHLIWKSADGDRVVDRYMEAQRIAERANLSIEERAGVPWD
jgi:hypothetical protein